MLRHNNAAAAIAATTVYRVARRTASVFFTQFFTIVFHACVFTLWRLLRTSHWRSGGQEALQTVLRRATQGGLAMRLPSSVVSQID
jgi:hypothetical protein